MNIQIDTREKARAIKKILAHFNDIGVKYYSSKLFVGDYMSLDNPRLIIDRKQNLLEVVSNVCQGHKRFVSEIQRACDNGIKLIFLVEHSKNIKTLDDVRNWENPRLATSPYAVSGGQLHKTLSTLQSKYGVEFLFCEKKDTGRRIVELLGEI